MKLLVKIPSRERGLAWVQKWIDRMELQNTHILLSLDVDEYPDAQSRIAAQNSVSNLGRVSFEFGESESKIHACNRDVKKYADLFDLIMMCGDDFEPVQCYDKLAVDCYKKEMDSIGRPYLLHCNDGFTQNRLCTYPIMGVDYYKRFGYIYHPQYKSFWCDNEQQDVALALGCYAYSPVVVAKHLHPANVATVRNDDLYLRQNANWKHDHVLYMKRKKMQFGL